MKPLKKSISKFFLIITISLLSLSSQPLLAQDFDDDVIDSLPINGLVALGLLVGAFYGVKKLKK